jgi:hypothetical protein
VNGFLHGKFSLWEGERRVKQASEERRSTI